MMLNTYIYRLTVVTCLLTSIMFLSGCSPVISNKNTSDNVSKYNQWPGKPLNDYAQLIIVNPFIKQCCGASAPYKVYIKNQAINFKYSRLSPVDDFFCVALPEGEYDVELVLNASKQTQRTNILFKAVAGEISCLAADVDLRQKHYNVSLYYVNQQQAMVYVNRALHRISRQKPWRAIDLQLSDAETQEMIDERLQRQLTCKVM